VNEVNVEPAFAAAVQENAVPAVMPAAGQFEPLLVPLPVPAVAAVRLYVDERLNCALTVQLAAGMLPANVVPLAVNGQVDAAHPTNDDPPVAVAVQETAEV
jgi:hypothetical protein